MRLLASICLAILLAACASPQPQRLVREGPTYDGQRDLDVLVSFFTGNWDPKPGETLPMRLRVVEFWKGSPVRWLYLEWAPLANEAKPARQLILRIAEDGEEHYMTATAHKLADAARYAGEWRKPEPFAGMRPADLREIAGCRLKAVRVLTAHFTLVTEGNKCPGDVPGSPFMRFEFSLSSSELALLEQPRDEAGNVPPSRLDPYQLGKMSRVPK